MRYLLVVIDEERAAAFEGKLAILVVQEGGYAPSPSHDFDAKKLHLRNCGEDLAGCSSGGIALLPLKNL